MIAPRRRGVRDDTETDDAGSGTRLGDDTQREKGGPTDEDVADAVKEVTASRLDTSGTTTGPNNVGEGAKDSTLKKKKADPRILLTKKKLKLRKLKRR